LPELPLCRAHALQAARQPRPRRRGPALAAVHVWRRVLRPLPQRSAAGPRRAIDRGGRVSAQTLLCSRAVADPA
jgi:hypothetical protein